MPRGGKRPGAGAKKGSVRASTISKEQAREALRQLVLQKMEQLVSAQMANAQGLKYLVTRDKKTGKFIRVTEAMAKLKQGDSEETIEVWEKDPSVQAFTDLMNRALDKPKEQEIDVTVKRIADESDEALLARAAALLARAQA
jgi:hypothetical protein